MNQEKDFHVAVNIVTWNSEEYIDDLLKSLEAQSFQNFYIIVVDNNSTDKTLEILEKYKRVLILRNSSNQGFSRAHNKAIDMAFKLWKNKPLEDKFVFVINPDIVLKEDCLEKILISIYNAKNTAVMSPKLLRIFDEQVDNMSHKSKSAIIDSMGLKIFKTRQVIDRFAGLEDKYNLNVENVFGVSGAFMCIRANALLNLNYNGKYFDEDFFAYKEDVDFCWRARNLGWNIKINPNAMAYHYRKARGDEKTSIIKKIKNQTEKPKFIKFLSARNHLWTIIKNDRMNNICVHLPLIFFWEFGKMLYTLFFDIKVFPAYFSMLKGIGKILKKRAYLKNIQSNAKEMKKWFK